MTSLINESETASVHRGSLMTPDPSHRLPTDTDDGLLLIISGPSGVGKTTVTRGVERALPESVFSVSATTREKTAADVEGVDYHFVTDEQFEQMKTAGEFLETAGVYGRKYGTPRAWVEAQLERGRVVILEIDVQGAIQVKKAMPEAFAIFILPPSEEILLGRLRARKREDEDSIQKRFGKAREEIAAAKECGVYDVFLTNERLDDAIRTAITRIQDERNRRRAL